MSAARYLMEYSIIFKQVFSMTFNDMEKNVYNLILRENRIEILQRYTPKKKV